MSLVSSNKTAANTVELTVKVDGEVFEKAKELAYKKGVKKISVPGFRKGKAPRAIIEKMYGKSFFVEDAVNNSYPEAYKNAVDETGIEPVDVADIDVTEVDENGFTFKATVTVKPEVTVKDYKGIKAEKVIKTVTDDEVQSEIDRMKERNSRLVDVADRAAENGDNVIIDYKGFVDDVAFAGGEAEKQTLVLGSGQFIPGFEEQVVGHNIGEEFDITVKFPEEYHSEDLKGKDAIFKIKLHEIKAKEYPEVDDEFAKDVSEFDTLEELKKDIAANLQKQYDDVATNNVENQILDAVAENMTAEIPECMFDKAIDNQISDLEYRLQSQGMTLEMYMQYTNTTIDALRKTFAEPAAHRVKVRLALEEIAKIEKIEISEDELNAEYAKMAEQYKLEIDQVKQFVPAEDLTLDVVINKTIDFVKENAVITEKAFEEEKEAAPVKKAPAKKAAAKKAPAKKKVAETVETTEETATEEN